MTIDGIIIGDRQNRKTALPNRLRVLATPRAATATINSVIAAVANPTLKERIIAPSQSGEAANSSNQRTLQLGGGNDRKVDPVNAIGTKAMIGTSRIPIMAQAYAERKIPPRRPRMLRFHVSSANPQHSPAKLA